LITIAGRNISVSQAGACTYDINPTSQIFAAGGGNVTVNVTAPAGCKWSAFPDAFFNNGFFTDVTWIHILAGASGSGNGLVTLKIDPNAGASRKGAVKIGGKTF
jgi:hypothetical protein